MESLPLELIATIACLLPLPSLLSFRATSTHIREGVRLSSRWYYPPYLTLSPKSPPDALGPLLSTWLPARYIDISHLPSSHANTLPSQRDQIPLRGLIAGENTLLPWVDIAPPRGLIHIECNLGIEDNQETWISLLGDATTRISIHSSRDKEIHAAKGMWAEVCAVAPNVASLALDSMMGYSFPYAYVGKYWAHLASVSVSSLSQQLVFGTLLPSLPNLISLHVWVLRRSQTGPKFIATVTEWASSDPCLQELHLDSARSISWTLVGILMSKVSALRSLRIQDVLSLLPASMNNTFSLPDPGDPGCSPGLLSLNLSGSKALRTWRQRDPFLFLTHLDVSYCSLQSRALATLLEATPVLTSLSVRGEPAFTDTLIASLEDVWASSSLTYLDASHTTSRLSLMAILTLCDAIPSLSTLVLAQNPHLQSEFTPIADEITHALPTTTFRFC